MKNSLAHAALAAMLITATPAWAMPGAAIHITDGDTIRLEDGERIRILPIDTPEISHPRCENEFRLGLAAKARIAAIIAPAADVSIIRHGKDRFGRTLAHVLADGRDVGDQLMREGIALPYRPGAAAKAWRLAQWCAGAP